MFLVVHSISRGLALVILLAGCAIFESPKPATSFSPKQRVYYADFDQVWRATQIAMTQYPMYINNIDKGLLETEVIRGYHVWTPPFAPDSSTGGLRYRLSLRVVKGRSRKKTAIKVTIIKTIEKRKDFFSKPVPLPSDGLEEESILYRIKRELQIERALQRAQKKTNPEL